MIVKNDPEYQHAYWEKNKERLREQRRAWYTKNRERVLREAAARREAEGDALREKKRAAWRGQKAYVNARRREAYRERPEVREKARYSARLWRERNQDRHREASRTWATQNRFAARERLRSWISKNPAKIRAIRIRRRTKLYEGGAVSTASAERLSIASTCAYCGDLFDPFSVAKRKTVDHVIPLCRGGTNADDNLLACCHRCNSQKGSLLLSEWICTGRAPALAENVSASCETEWTPVKRADTEPLPERGDPERPMKMKHG